MFFAVFGVQYVLPALYALVRKQKGAELRHCACASNVMDGQVLGKRPLDTPEDNAEPKRKRVLFVSKSKDTLVLVLNFHFCSVCRVGSTSRDLMKNSSVRHPTIPKMVELEYSHYHN